MEDNRLMLHWKHAKMWLPVHIIQPGVLPCQLGKSPDPQLQSRISSAVSCTSVVTLLKENLS